MLVNVEYYLRQIDRSTKKRIRGVNINKKDLKINFATREIILVSSCKKTWNSS